MAQQHPLELLWFVNSIVSPEFGSKRLASSGPCILETEGVNNRFQPLLVIDLKACHFDSKSLCIPHCHTTPTPRLETRQSDTRIEGDNFQ